MENPRPGRVGFRDAHPLSAATRRAPTVLFRSAQRFRFRDTPPITSTRRAGNIEYRSRATKFYRKSPTRVGSGFGTGGLCPFRCAQGKRLSQPTPWTFGMMNPIPIRFSRNRVPESERISGGGFREELANDLAQAPLME
jgi:hypothetical protein